MATKPSPYNHNIRVVTSIFSVALAFAGFTHGFFEMLQGNIATSTLFINSIGLEQGMWGEDPAFTLIPNFYITGITAMVIGVAIAIWAIVFIHQPRGPLILLLLFIAQTLAGGGIGYIPFYLATFIWASRIDKPALAWPHKLPAGLCTALAAIWLPLTIISTLLWVALLIESVAGFTVPTFGDDVVLNAIWITLLIVMGLINLAFSGAALRDAQMLQRRSQPQATMSSELGRNLSR